MENCSFETFSGGSWRSHDCLRYTQSACGLCEAGSSRALPFTACCWRLNSLLPALRKLKKRSKTCTFFVGRGGVQGSAKPLHVPLTNTKGAICWNVTFLRGEKRKIEATGEAQDLGFSYSSCFLALVIRTITQTLLNVVLKELGKWNFPLLTTVWCCPEVCLGLKVFLL